MWASLLVKFALLDYTRMGSPLDLFPNKAEVKVTVTVHRLTCCTHLALDSDSHLDPLFKEQVFSLAPSAGQQNLLGQFNTKFNMAGAMI